MLPAEHAEMLDRVERRVRYLWAAQAVGGRAVLDVGCRDGAGTATLGGAGASPVVGIDPFPQAVEAARREFGQAARFEVAEPTALPYDDHGFDFVTCFEALASAPEPESVLDGIQRAMKTDGVLLASLPSGENSGALADALRSRFRQVALHEQAWYAGSAIGGVASDEIAVGLSPTSEIEPRSLVAAASDAELPTLEPVLGIEEIAGLEALVTSVSRWEERARGAEAEVAAMRWELRIAGEKLTALVQRLLELENSPSRRLRRRLSGGPGRYSADEVADPSGSVSPGSQR
jgi:SAM-dependent methyltransferase